MPSFDWTPDGSGLIFGSTATERGAVGLRVLDLGSGAWREIRYARQALDIDAAPRYSPDGRWIVFVRNAPLGDFWRIPAQGGTPERLSRLHADIRGWDWLPEGSALLFGAMVDGESRMFRLDLHDGSARALDIADGQSPAVARARRAMAFVQRRPYFSLFRVALNDAAEEAAGSGRVHVLEPLFPSSSREVLPTPAPDGRQFVFVSDRSGSNGLWWADLTQPDSLRMIAGVRPVTRFAPAWSDDSRRLLVVGSDEAGHAVLQEVTPASGRAVALPLPLAEPLQAAYLPGAERLLVLAGGPDGRLRLHLLDRSRQPWRVLAAIDDVSRFQVDAARGRVLFSRQAQSGLWQADLELSPLSRHRLNAEAPELERNRMWAVAPDGGVLYLDQRQGCAALLRRAEPSGGQAPARCLDQTRRSALNGFGLSPRGDALFLALVEWDGADIGFMELSEEPAGGVGGWGK
ncbi:WD40 repeat protein [Vulcaniibacterium tengchongense]|uniref:WD40 repeat protein n=2 Tax=Vulcaniibacterium tengchongense TaxID=1273429 RepID=A0A3N4VEZ4_9GAMM|nr:PD40 domain-containing protein [Vulcaniibacterium tengchongense]RPE75747.1 WD40 repeat protein [Vulcaniibacterium tengchongense]